MERLHPARRWAPTVVVGVAAAVTCGLVVFAAGSAEPQVPTSYAATSPWLRAADLTAGLGLVLTGLIARCEPRTRGLGLLVVLAGCAWFTPDWDGWAAGPALVRSLGVIAEPVYLALIVHVVVSAPRGELRSQAARIGVYGVYIAALVAGMGLAAVRDPFLDPYCWRNCLHNVFVVHPDQRAARLLQLAWTEVAVMLGISIAAICVWRIRASTPAARRVALPVALPGIAVGLAAAADAAWLLHAPIEDPTNSVFGSLFVLQALAAIGLAGGILTLVINDRYTRALIAHLALDIGRAPTAGTLQAALASVIGDPNLEVAYWLPASQRYVDVHGTSRPPPQSDSDRVVTRITRDGRILALVGHAADASQSVDLEREIGSASRLAIDNERLRAESLAQLDDLRTSLARIVEAGDAERERLERNLHDGAQQRLLAVLVELRLAQAGLGFSDAESERELANALEHVHQALGELRTLANGIYPVVLTEAGLASALVSFADDAPLPVVFVQLPDERYAAAVERGAFVAISEAIRDAVVRAATFARVEVTAQDGWLLVTVTDDGRPPIAPAQHLSDRVGALGGRACVREGALSVSFPCG